MLIKKFLHAAFALFLCALLSPHVIAESAGKAELLVIGDTFTMQSKALGETRRINVYKPPGYTDTGSERLPVLVMPDGGIEWIFCMSPGWCRCRWATGQCDRSCWWASRTPSAVVT